MLPKVARCCGTSLGQVMGRGNMMGQGKLLKESCEKKN